MAGTFAGSYCSSHSTHYCPAAQQFPRAYYIFACVVSVILSVSSTLGDTMILRTLRKCQSLHSPSKALLSNLALTDLFVGLIVLPLFTAHYLMIILEMSRYYCAIAITYGRTSTFIVGVSLHYVLLQLLLIDISPFIFALDTVNSWTWDELSASLL